MKSDFQSSAKGLIGDSPTVARGSAMRWEGEMCIVSGSYQAVASTPPRTTVELWCRAREGHSVVVLVQGLKPFLEIALPGKPREAEAAALSLDLVREMSEVTGIGEPVDKWTPMGVKPHWRVDVEQPYVVPRLRKRLLADNDWEVTSADILFVQRLLLDLDLGPHVRVAGEVLWAGSRAPAELAAEFDGGRVEAAERIRDFGGSGLYPCDVVISCTLADLSRADPFPAPFVTLSLDLETSVKHNTILCAAVVIDRGGSRTEHEFRGAEKDILEGMTRLVRDEDPDFITGYNIDNFDLPRIIERAEENSGRSRFEQAALCGWGRVPAIESEAKRLKPERAINRVWRMTGRIPMDAWWQVRQTLRPERESLRFVANMLWPDSEDKQKLDIDASRMDEEWAARPDEVMEYCVRDTHLPLDILGHLQSVERKEALAAVASTTVETAAAGTTSQWIDSLVIRLADRENIAVPRTQSGPRRRDQIAGGYVHEVEPGIHPWVAVLDFKSMYPSIMIAQNICSTTLVRDGRVDSSHNISPATSTRYVSTDERKGLVPRLLSDLMTRRDHHKEELKKARESGDEEAAFLHDQLQYAVKILMNSFYGVFASSFYRFTHPDLGASITEWARHNIRTIIASLEKDGSGVVYSDTDSIFVRAPVEPDSPINRPPETALVFADWNAAREETLRFGHRLAERFTREGAELEFETALSAFFSHGAKKRYVGRVVWPREEMLIRGYEVRRTDSFRILTRTMTEMFELILANDPWSSVELTKTVIDDVRSRRIEVADLVISRSCKGSLRRDGSVDFTKAYKNPDSLPYVRAAKQRIEAGLGFTPGMKVGWIVTNAKTSPMTIEAWMVDELGVEPPVYDPEFYARRLATALGRITEAFGWNQKELLEGTRQQTLSDFF